MSGRVIFCHGLESGPHGRKYHALVDAGWDVTAPDCRDRDVGQRLTLVRPLLEKGPTPILVGSSYGGLVAYLAALEAFEAGRPVKGLVLCAPALGRKEPPVTDRTWALPAPTTILHGVDDDIVPIDGSRDFVQRFPTARLIELDDGHRLAESADRILDAVAELASR